ncbi:MAG: hypothetical protein AAF913_15805, partial [Pseudomonadota bacterium]
MHSRQALRMKRLDFPAAPRAQRAITTVCAVALLALPHAAPVAAQSGDRVTVDLAAIDWNTVPVDVDGFPGVPLFTMPFVKAQMDLVTTATAQGELQTALRIVGNLLRRYPLVADFHATKAALLAATGDVNEALAALNT